MYKKPTYRAGIIIVITARGRDCLPLGRLHTPPPGRGGRPIMIARALSTPSGGDPTVAYTRRACVRVRIIPGVRTTRQRGENKRTRTRGAVKMYFAPPRRDRFACVRACVRSCVLVCLYVRVSPREKGGRRNGGDSIDCAIAGRDDDDDNGGALHTHTHNFRRRARKPYDARVDK